MMEVALVWVSTLTNALPKHREGINYSRKLVVSIKASGTLCSAINSAYLKLT